MKTAEEIIISKRFFELSPSEKELIKDYASNEEDYEAMRWFLISAGNSFAQEKIEPSAGLRKGVIAHLQQKQTAPKTIWLNGVGAFLFPAEKRFYQAPAFQMAAVAAVIVSVVLIYNANPLKPDLAVIDQQAEPVTMPMQEEPMTSTGTNDGTTLDTNQPLNQQNSLPDAVDQDKVTVSENTVSKSLTLENETEDISASDDYYYREMAVAEEVKLNAEIDEMKESPAQELTTNGQVFNPNNGSYNVASTDKFGTGIDRKMDLSKKEDTSKQKNTEYKVSRSETDVNGQDGDLTNTVAPAGPAVDATTVLSGTIVTEKNTGEQNVGTTTSTAGGVYYSYTTTKDSSGNGYTSLEDAEEEENAAKYSITETKALKKLFFTVK
jgi:hypothetical protein